MELQEPIRYAAGDSIEAWLNDLLCLNAADHIPRITGRSEATSASLDLGSLAVCVSMDLVNDVFGVSAPVRFGFCSNWRRAFLHSARES